MTQSDLLTAQEAARLLGVRAATLYAYVSRGLIPLAAGEGRESRYRRSDLLAWKERRAQGKNPRRAARGSLDFGLPVLESAITLIEDGRLYYRGIDATELVATASLESVAALIWDVSERELFTAERMPQLPGSYDSIKPALDALPFLERAQGLLALAGSYDTQAFDRSGLGVAATGVRILRLLLATACGTWPAALPLELQLERAWRLGPAAAKVLRAALVLVADHELNPSTFAVRTVAATGATPYACVIAGLSALSGPLHGGMTARVAAMFDEIGERDPAQALGERLRRGERLPGFGHRLYPEGDPRAKCLLRLIATSGLPAEVRRAEAIAAAAHRLIGRKPNIDFALVAAARALRLPAGAAFMLFTLGRTVGWIGHAIEQQESGRMLRPRAAYTGPRPTSR